MSLIQLDSILIFFFFSEFLEGCQLSRPDSVKLPPVVMVVRCVMRFDMDILEVDNILTAGKLLQWINFFEKLCISS